jgi:dTDP-4-dehydrorhamnose 3,5-epimerase
VESADFSTILEQFKGIITGNNVIEYTSPDQMTFGNRTVLEAGDGRPKAMKIPPGVVHAYRNIGATPGSIINLSNRLRGGEGRREKVDEILHENDPNTIF